MASTHYIPHRKFYVTVLKPAKYARSNILYIIIIQEVRSSVTKITSKQELWLSIHKSVIYLNIHSKCEWIMLQYMLSFVLSVVCVNYDSVGDSCLFTKVLPVDKDASKWLYGHHVTVLVLFFFFCLKITFSVQLNARGCTFKQCWTALFMKMVIIGGW